MRQGVAVPQGFPGKLSQDLHIALKADRLRGGILLANSARFPCDITCGVLATLMVPGCQGPRYGDVPVRGPRGSAVDSRHFEPTAFIADRMTDANGG